MQKPRSYIHVKKSKTYPEFGVLVIGRTAIPVYIVLNVSLVLTMVLVIAGGIVVDVSDGTNWTLMYAALIPAALLFVGFIVGGFISMVTHFAKNIKKATRIERGLESESRY